LHGIALVAKGPELGDVAAQVAPASAASAAKPAEAKPAKE